MKFTSNIAPGHIAATVTTSSEGILWLDDRFADKTAPSTC
ncbi:MULTISPECIES: lipase family protein [unclassified Streptomyces]|nr:lipase family protein [Streptomyces sp. CLI2509]